MKNIMIKEINCYLSKEQLVSLKGESLGEPEHYNIKVEDKTLYLGDCIDVNEIEKLLKENNVIPDTDYEININNGELKIGRF